jgi:hypothetical protein
MATTLPSADALETAAVAPRRAALVSVVRAAGWERALLACDFAAPDRPALVTALLLAFLTERTGTPVEPVEIWDLAVSTRHLLLVRIVAALEGTDTFALQLRCPTPGCRELLEVPLSLAALAALHDEHAARDTLGAPGDGAAGALTLRRPTGDDLRRWHAILSPANGSFGPPAILRDLVVAGRLPENSVSLADALEAFDPLLAFAFTMTCPACGSTADHALDLEALALTRLQARQTLLQREIHRLALAYGWTESEILAVPASRRSRYLKFIDAGLEP